MLFLCYPKCTTCQKAKKWLDENNISYELRDIKEANPSYEELKKWYEMSGVELKKFFNTSGLLYKSMELKDKLPAMSDEEKLQLLATDGMLVKRPLVVTDDGNVLLGFKEENYKLLTKVYDPRKVIGSGEIAIKRRIEELNSEILNLNLKSSNISLDLLVFIVLN